MKISSPFKVRAALILSAMAFSGYAVATSYSSFELPDELSPVWNGANGFSADETKEARARFNAIDIQTANDSGAYATSNLSEFLPMSMVPRSGQVSELKQNENRAIGSVSYNSDLGELTLDEVLADPRSRMKGVLVIHKGKIVYEQYPGMRDTDNHFWASTTKTMVSLVIAQLENEGKVELTAPISKYIPELKNTEWEHIPVAEVLHQNSGMDVGERNVGTEGHPINRFYQLASGDTSTTAEGTSLLQTTLDAKKIREPGDMFEYSSINTFLLGLVAENVTGKPMHDLFSERVWSKAGMEGDALLGLSPTGEPVSAGVFTSRLRDLGRYGMLYTPSWSKVADTPVVPSDYLDKTYKAVTPDTFTEDYLSQRVIKNFGTNCIGASYQWDAIFCDGDLYKSGRTGQALYVSPETDTVVAWFSSSYDNILWLEGYSREIVNSVYR
ncbi:serine hydrolase domain-containing protein [Vibrio sp. HN007]|uniref:serine hydrolase domain-containing protein n=1 Tax=Vibrio iocasae TaxID=3098914 RepID=UPI0035D42182